MVEVARREQYLEYLLDTIDSTPQDLHTIVPENFGKTQISELSSNLQYPVDTEGQHLVELNNNPAIMQDLSIWLDKNYEFSSSGWEQDWRQFYNRQNKIYPDSITSLKTKQNRLFQANGFRSFLTPEAQSVFNKLMFFDEHFESKSLRALSQNALAGHLSLYDLYAADGVEFLEDLISTIEYEVLDLSVDILRLDSGTRSQRTQKVRPTTY